LRSLDLFASSGVSEEAVATKGSDKWGQGSGPRVDIVVAVLLAISVLGVAFYYLETRGLTTSGQGGGVSTISTTGISCGSDSLTPTVLAVERDPSFTALSGGRCYNFFGQSGPSGGNSSTLTFVHYNGTITYPCGTSAEQVPDSEIQAVVTTGGALVSALLVEPSGFSQAGACDESIPLRVVSVDDVESTIPAVPQLNLTLASAAGGRPVTALHAVLTLDGGSQSFLFKGIAPSSPLAPGSFVSVVEIVLSGVSFSSSEVYPMTISGTFDDGKSFTYVAHAQIAHAP
jgi:hypothetical protein